MPELTSISDEGLLRDLQFGDHEAFSELMRRHCRLVYRVANSILHDHGEAEDMVQHVFWEIYQSRAKFDPARGAARTWLLQFAYSRSIGRLEYLTRRKFYQATDVSDAANQLYVDESVAAELESRELIGLALAQLNERQRRVIHLAQLEGHSLREVAEQIGEPYQSVRHHYYRGLEKMRALLACTAVT